MFRLQFRPVIRLLADRLDKGQQGSEGSALFARRVRERYQEEPLRGIGGQRELRRRVPVQEVRLAVERLKGVPWRSFGARYGDWGCALFLWDARRLCGLTLREIGEKAGGMDFSAVSHAIRRFERQAARDRSLAALQQELVKISKT